MKAALPYMAVLGVLLMGPLLLRQKAGRREEGAEERLVIISPHNEATRYEFGRAFEEEHFKRTGRRVFVDWRTVGGTAEAVRYVTAQFAGSFRHYWTAELHREWTAACMGYDDPKATGPALEAREAFLKSDASCGADLFAGGGTFDYMQMAAAGRLAESGVVARHPELFGPGGAIPQRLGGETLWDPKGLWVGACLGEFGICWNRDEIVRLRIKPLEEWSALGEPVLEDEVALADPTQSGSVGKAFEMLLQQQMTVAGGNAAAGWLRGMRLIERISANARYFAGSATEIPYAVQAGDAAAGMCIDFYGRFESESVREPDGNSRLVYTTPRGGSSTGADGIGMFFGAPHPALAREFIEFTMSPAGQKLWCFRVGTPGGPRKYALRRLPILPSLYEPQWKPYEADPEAEPYAAGRGLEYHAEWTGSLFGVIGFVIRTAFIDPHEELKEAWRALIRAGFPPEATAVFGDLSAIDYVQAGGPIRAALKSPDKLKGAELARELDERFRAQYRRAAALAEAGQ